VEGSAERRFRVGRRLPARHPGLLPLSALLLASGCELQEIVVSQPEPRVVAEIYVQAGAFGPRGFAYLHRSAGSASAAVPGARIVLETSDGRPVRFSEAPLEECLLGALPPERLGSCYAAEAATRGRIRAGVTLHATVELEDGGSLRGTTTVPGDFRVTQPALGVGAAPVCVVPPGTQLQVAWTPSAGTWAYVAETQITGIAEAVAARGGELRSDPLVLLGLAISREDTTIVFPAQFGVFDRVDLDREVALLLQEGLPPGAGGEVVLAAGDRNYVNWVRGGGFNPSGQVRIPSLVGTGGTGVFGSQVTRRFFVETGTPGPDRRACTGILGDG